MENQLVEYDNQKALNRIKEEIEIAREDLRSDYILTIYVRKALWLGESKIYNGLLKEYNNGNKLFLLDSAYYGLINDLRNELHLLNKFMVYLTIGSKINDDKYIISNHLWNEPDADNYSKLDDYLKNKKLPDNKIPAEHIVMVKLEDAKFFGVLDEKTYKYFQSINTSIKAATSKKVLDVEKTICQKAFANSIKIMDDNNVKKATAVINLNWLDYYKKEAEFRDIKWIVHNCTEIFDI